MPLDQTEWVVRSALYPKIMDAGLVAPEQIVSPFSPKIMEDGIEGFALSVGRTMMLPDVAAVHDFGCRVADAANVGLVRRKGGELIRGKETVHYRGAYDLSVEKVSEIHSDTFSIGVEHCPEHGLDEHCDIELRPRDPQMSKTQRSKARTGVIAKLYLLLRNPRPYVCECDEDLRGMLEQIELPDITPT